jgi:predicted TIM-barrel fold metal-dependent hydrolase
MDAPFRESDKLMEKLHAKFATRVLWGSDWPHTWYMEDLRGGAPAFETLFAPLARVFPDAAIRQSILSDAPARLYQ